jgi:hypothetical protein
VRLTLRRSSVSITQKRIKSSLNFDLSYSLKFSYDKYRGIKKVQVFQVFYVIIFNFLKIMYKIKYFVIIFRANIFYLENSNTLNFYLSKFSYEQFNKYDKLKLEYDLIYFFF